MPPNTFPVWFCFLLCQPRIFLELFCCRTPLQIEDQGQVISQVLNVNTKLFQFWFVCHTYDDTLSPPRGHSVPLHTDSQPAVPAASLSVAASNFKVHTKTKHVLMSQHVCPIPKYPSFDHSHTEISQQQMYAQDDWCFWSSTSPLCNAMVLCTRVNNQT